jgi:hypothetical protein
MALPVHVRRDKVQSEPIPPVSVLMMERHFTFKELAEMWGFSEDFINRRFRDEPGVICTQKAPTRGRRAHGILRVPQSIAERVYTRMMVIS